MTFTNAISLTESMSDPNLLGKVFASPTYWTWKVVAKIIDGIPLTESPFQNFIKGYKAFVA